MRNKTLRKLTAFSLVIATESFNGGQNNAPINEYHSYYVKQLKAYTYQFRYYENLSSFLETE